MTRTAQAILSLLTVFCCIVASKACHVSVQDICLLNGAGVHCHPCSSGNYIVCTSDFEGNVQSCSGGRWWDAFSARCVDSASNTSPCLAGINIVLPQAAPSGQLSLVDDLSPVSQYQQAKQHGWLGWASRSLSNLVSPVASQISEHVPAILGVLAPEETSADSGRSFLRMQMLGTPTLQQLQQMHANLIKAGDMHSHAVSMLQDAQLATEVAAKDVAAAKSLLLGAAVSSNDAVEMAAAVDQARLLLQQAAAAQVAADSMRQTADSLILQSASEAAGVSLDVSDVSQQQQTPLQLNAAAAAAAVPAGNSLGIQQLAFVGDILDSVVARSAPGATSDLFIDAEDYYYGDDYTYNTVSDDVSGAMQSTEYLATATPAEGDVPEAAPTASHLGSEDTSSLAAVQQEREFLLAQLDAVSDVPPIGTSNTRQPAPPVTDFSDNSRAIDFSDIYDELAVREYDEAESDLSPVDAETAKTAVAGRKTDNAQVTQQQQQASQLNGAAIESGGLMSTEVLAWWQQRGRKNVGGRSHIKAAVADVKHKRL